MDRLSETTSYLQGKPEFHLINTKNIIISPDMQNLINNHCIVQDPKMGPAVDHSFEFPVSEAKYTSLMDSWNDCDIMPIYVTKKDDKYSIIDGRHRYCAYIIHGYENIPVLVR